MNKKVIVGIIILVVLIAATIGIIFSLNYFKEKNKEYEIEKVKLADCKYFVVCEDRQIWRN